MRYCCIKQHIITDCGAALLGDSFKTIWFEFINLKIREVAGTDSKVQMHMV